MSLKFSTLQDYGMMLPMYIAGLQYDVAEVMYIAGLWHDVAKVMYI